MLAFYLDQHVPLAVARGLRGRGIDVLTAFEAVCPRSEPRATGDPDPESQAA